MNREYRASCHVVNEGCRYPPSHEPLNGTCRSRCFACGLSVCQNCSLIRDWYLWRHKRVCAHCHEEVVRLAARVLRVINGLDREIARLQPRPRRRKPRLQ